MRGVRFFEEYSVWEECGSAGNVIAVHLTHDPLFEAGGLCLSAVAASAESRTPNSPVTPTYFSAEYLGKRCRGITEARAREIHPRLFEYLDRVA
ncbi:MAG: hypothetical protein WKG32_03105 [Gemmatimonadaceae bacterium]